MLRNCGVLAVWKDNVSGNRHCAEPFRCRMCATRSVRNRCFTGPPLLKSPGHSNASNRIVRTLHENLAERVEPLLARVERLLRVGDFLLVARRLCVSELALEFRDGVMQLARETLRARLLLGVALVPVILV